jgi:hypothetical protein
MQSPFRKRLPTSPNEESPFNFSKLQSVDAENFRFSTSVLERTQIKKLNDLKIRLGDREYVELPISNYSVTPKATQSKIAHVESTSEQEVLRPKLQDSKNETAIKCKYNIGRQSQIIEHILSAGSYKNVK